MATYVEITKSDHGHGGAGWEFGTCLWSPSRNRAGGDRYSIMREPQQNDRVIHIYRQEWPDGKRDTRIAGESKISNPCHEIIEEPPSPGD